jgi:hypothetical protein
LYFLCYKMQTLSLFYITELQFISLLLINFNPLVDVYFKRSDMKSSVFFAGISLFFLASSNLNGQKLTPQVISSAGASASGGGVELSWTVGEPIVSTFMTSNNILTQGYHQGKLEVTAIDIPDYPELVLLVYPNPVSTTLMLNIKGDGIKNFSLHLYNMEGKMLINKQVEMLPALINLEPFADGAYLLTVFMDDEKPIGTFRIVKN